MPRSSSRNRSNTSRNNNPEGRNQYSSGVMDIARERPMTAALGAAAAVGAGVFLWSRRNQISEQLSELSDQFIEWRESMGTETAFEPKARTDFSGSASNFTTSKSARQPKRKSQRQMSEEALTLKQTGETGPTGI